MTEDITVTKGSGDVFADLGFDNPEEEQLKAQLVREIRDLLKGHTQAKPAELLRLKQPDISAIVNGNTGRFSIQDLRRCIQRLRREAVIS